MNNVFGLIYTGENDSWLRDLTLTRAIAALPVAGRFRMIDFLMSSMVHTGIRNVGVITQKNYHSLMDHLGSGKEWDLHRKNDGLFILPPFLTRDNVGIYAGMLDALRSNSGYLRRSKQDYVLLSNSHFLYNTDYRDMISDHIQAGADITMLYARRDSKDLGTSNEDYAYLELDETQRVTGLEINPTVPSYPNELLEAYVMKRELLRYLVDQAVAHGLHHFRRDVIQRVVNDRSLLVRGYPHQGHFWRVNSVQAYFKMNMDLLQSEIRRAVFIPDQPVYTKVRDDMPTQYGPNASLSNSLIADGGYIDGRVENSVIFRGVRIEKGAVIRNSIIMQDSQVQEGAELNHCILDKQAVIRSRGRLMGPASYPIVIAKNMMI